MVGRKVLETQGNPWKTNGFLHFGISRTKAGEKHGRGIFPAEGREKDLGAFPQPKAGEKLGVFSRPKTGKILRGSFPAEGRAEENRRSLLFIIL